MQAVPPLEPWKVNEPLDFCKISWTKKNVVGAFYDRWTWTPPPLIRACVLKGLIFYVRLNKQGRNSCIKVMISWHRLPMTAYIVRRNPKINFLLQHSNRQELCCFHGNTMKYLTDVLSTLLLQPPDSWDKFFDRFCSFRDCGLLLPFGTLCLSIMDKDL